MRLTSSNNSSAKEDKRQVFASVEYRAINYNSDVSTWIVGQDAIQNMRWTFWLISRLRAAYRAWDQSITTQFEFVNLLQELTHESRWQAGSKTTAHSPVYWDVKSSRPAWLEVKIFGLSLVTPDSTSASSSCNTGLVLTKVVLVASLSVIEITSFTLCFSVIENCFTFYWS